MNSKISLIIPVYNVEKYISKCIKSVVNQTYKNLEIMIINDGSTDSSFDICNFYADKDDRITIINQENQGLSVARNNALDIATGEYIGFIDGDDWIASDMYEILHNNILKYDAEISMCNFSIYENEKINSPKINYNVNHMLVLEGHEKIKKIVYHNNMFVWNKLYKSYLFNDLRFPVNKTYEDAFVVPKLINKATKLIISPKSLYYNTIRSDSITNMPFTPSRLNMILANIEVYEYMTSISLLESDLEKLCRKRIFISLLVCISSATSAGIIKSCMQEIEEIISLVKKYNIYKCDLEPNIEKIIKLILEDIKKYIILYNYSNNMKNI